MNFFFCIVCVVAERESFWLHCKSQCCSDLWDVSSSGGNWGAAGGLWGNSRGAGHSWALLVFCAVVCHLRKKENVSNEFFRITRPWTLFGAASCSFWSPILVLPDLPALRCWFVPPCKESTVDTDLGWAGRWSPYLWRLIDEGLGRHDRDLCGGDATG